MAEKSYYIVIDGKKIYVSEEEYRAIRRSEEKEKYFMEGLKHGRTVVDDETQTVKFIPGREVSYERLLEMGWDMPAGGEPVEDIPVRDEALDKLGEAVQSLSDSEQELLRELYYLDKTESEISEAYHVTQQAINKRKQRILHKLKKYFENF